MTSSAAATPAVAAAPAAIISFYRCYSDYLSDTELSPSLMVASRGVLKADKVTGVLQLSRYREGRQDYLFARLTLQELQGKTAFDIWIG